MKVRRMKEGLGTVDRSASSFFPEQRWTAETTAGDADREGRAIEHPSRRVSSLLDKWNKIKNRGGPFVPTWDQLRMVGSIGIDHAVGCDGTWDRRKGNRVRPPDESTRR